MICGFWPSGTSAIVPVEHPNQQFIDFNLFSETFKNSYDKKYLEVQWAELVRSAPVAMIRNCRLCCQAVYRPEQVPAERMSSTQSLPRTRRTLSTNER